MNRSVVIVSVLFFLCAVVGFHDFAMPLIESGDEVIDSASLSNVVASGDLNHEMALVGLALLGAVLLWRARDRIAIEGMLGWVIVGFSTLDFASVLWSDDPALCIRRLGVFLSMGMAMLGLATFSARRIVWIITLVGFYGLILGITNEVILGTFAPWRSDYRFAGSLHPNSQGIALAMLLLGSVILLFADRRGTALKWTLILVSIVFLYLTRSRTAIVCAVFAFCFLVALDMYHRRPRRFAVAVLVATAVLACIIGSGQSGELLEAALARPQGQIDDADIGTLTGRTLIWETCLDYARNRLLLGYGYESFWSPERIVDISQRNQWPINQAHSTYVELLLGTGIVGLATYVVMFLLALSASLRQFFRRGAVEYLGIASLLIFNLAQGLSESITIMPMIGGAVTMLLVSKLGLVRPRMSHAPPFRRGAGRTMEIES